MKLIGLIRLGQDADMRYTNDGTPVANLSGAWNYGRKGEDGKRPTQWASFTLWGECAEALQQYLLKGTALVVYASDVHIETYEGRNGQGHKLVGKIDDLQFAGGGQQQGQGAAPAPAQRSSAAAPRPPAPAPRPANTGSGFDDMDDDIPF